MLQDTHISTNPANQTLATIPIGCADAVLRLGLTHQFDTLHKIRSICRKKLEITHEIELLLLHKTGIKSSKTLWNHIQILRENNLIGLSGKTVYPHKLKNWTAAPKTGYTFTLDLTKPTEPQLFGAWAAYKLRNHYHSIQARNNGRLPQRPRKRFHRSKKQTYRIKETTSGDIGVRSKHAGGLSCTLIASLLSISKSRAFMLRKSACACGAISKSHRFIVRSELRRSDVLEYLEAYPEDTRIRAKGLIVVEQVTDLIHSNVQIKRRRGMGC